VKDRLANGQTAAQAEQLRAARAKRWENSDRKAHAVKMHLGMARRIVADYWPEGLPEFEARIAARGGQR